MLLLKVGQQHLCLTISLLHFIQVWRLLSYLWMKHYVSRVIEYCNMTWWLEHSCYTKLTKISTKSTKICSLFLLSPSSLFRPGDFPGQLGKVKIKLLDSCRVQSSVHLCKVLFIIPLQTQLMFTLLCNNVMWVKSYDISLCNCLFLLP